MQNDFYNSVNTIFEDSPEIDLMNHGYIPLHTKSLDVFLEPSASLYLHMADKFNNIENRNILDIGCGRGGGTKLLKKHYGFSKVFGCDANEKNINHCNLFSADCNFFVSDAVTLKEVPNEYFDFIINVESSHCYSDFGSFLRSVKRVMKKDGEFIICDIWNLDEVKHVRSEIQKNFIISEVQDITKNVEMSCKFIFEKFDSFKIKKKSYEWMSDLYKKKHKTYLNKEFYFYFFHLR